MKRNKIIIIIAILISLLLIVLLVFTNRESEIITEPERYGQPSIELIDKENKLYYSFVREDYVLVRNAMTQYVITQNGDPYTYKFEIKEVKTPFRDGDETTIAAVLLNGESKKVKDVTFVVKIPPNSKASVFSVPAENYSVPLYIGD